VRYYSSVSEGELTKRFGHKFLYHELKFGFVYSVKG